MFSRLSSAGGLGETFFLGKARSGVESTMVAVSRKRLSSF
jgi:hypothetical protein